MGSNASYMFPSLIAKKFDVTVIAPKPRQSELESIVFSDPNVNVAEISNGRVAHRAQEAALLIEKIDPDIVHVLGHPSCFLYPMLSKRIQRRDRKWLLDIRTHIFGLTRLRHTVEKLLNFYLQKYYDHMCYTAKTSMHTVLYGAKEPYSWVPIGINLAAFKPPKAPRPRILRKFVFVGSIARARKLSVLISNFGEFAKQSTVPVILNVYGSGNDLDALKSLTEERGYEKFIKFHGLVSASEVSGILAKHDAGFVFLPKDKFNNAPALKRIEYAAAGVDIIESDTIYHKFNPENFNTVLIPDDEQGFIDQINKYTSKPIDMESRFHNFEMAKRFDWNYIIENDLMPIYHEFIPDLAKLD